MDYLMNIANSKTFLCHFRLEFIADAPKYSISFARPSDFARSLAP